MKKALLLTGTYKFQPWRLLLFLFVCSFLTVELHAQVVAYRVNAGGRVTAAGDGSFPEWSADEQLAEDPPPIQFARNGVPSPYVNEDVAGDQTAGRSQAINLGNLTIGEGYTEELFTTQRWDVNPPEANLVYSFPVTVGRSYTVRLYFTELFGEGQNTREFDVLIEGELVEDDLDILENTSNIEKVAIAREYDLVAGDDMLDVEFLNQTDLVAVISALEIVDNTSSNQAPLATNPGRQASDLAETISLQIVASDSDEGQTLTYEAEGLPEGLSINASTGLISGTIESGVTGEFDVKVTVSDDGDPQAGAILIFQWGVGVDPIVIEPIADVVAEVLQPDDEIDLTVVFQDPNALDLTYSIESNSNTAAVSASLNETGDGVVLNYTSSVPGVADITVRATNTDGQFGEDTFTVTVTDPALAGAVVQVTPTSNLGGSTFDGNSMVIENTSAGSVQISQVTIDLTNSLFPDLVFDPTGVAGDSGAKCLTPDTGADVTGFINPANPCINPFSSSSNGGFLVITLHFDDFDSGETFMFSVDVDPTSIQGNPGVGDAGSVGGIEMIGSEVTVEFSDGSTIVNDLFYIIGSEGGSQAILEDEVNEEINFLPAVAPEISIDGVEGGTASVTEVEQNIVVTGPANATVILFQSDARLNLEGTPNGGFDIDPFEANEAIGVVKTYSATIGGGGSVTIPVQLDRSFFDGGFTGGLNHFIAAINDGVPGRTSNSLVMELEEAFTTSVIEGWNLIGLSLDLELTNYQSIFGDLVSDIPPFGWGGSGYVEVENLLNGQGYWLNADLAGTVPLFGTEITSQSVTLQEGWNMISGPTCAVNVDDISDPSTVIEEGTFFEYTGSYENATEIAPNVGYWVKATGAGTITMNCAVVAKNRSEATSESTGLESFGTLVIKDQAQTAQKLMFGGELEGNAALRSYAMPPVGPSGFDARFADGNWLTEGEEGVIKIKSTLFPVSLSMESAPEGHLEGYVVEAIAGNDVIETYALSEGMEVIITNPDVIALRIAAHSDEVDILPETFDLAGNYPNPFNPTTTIVFDLPEDATMRLEVYDLLGRRVMEIESMQMSAGAGRQIQLDASNLASGSYIYRVHASMAERNMVQTGRMTLLK